MERIWGMLDAMGIDVEYTDLPNGRDGEYLHDRKLIRLRCDMSSRLHRSVLAHECAHAVFADVPSMFGPVNAKQERRADEWAALRLITVDTLRLVEAYQRVLLRVGDTVYLEPRMGAGQHLHKERISS